MYRARVRKRPPASAPPDPDAWWQKEESTISRIFQLVGALRGECRSNPEATKLIEALSDALWEANLYD